MYPDNPFAEPIPGTHRPDSPIDAQPVDPQPTRTQFPGDQSTTCSPSCHNWPLFSVSDDGGASMDKQRVKFTSRYLNLLEDFPFNC